MAAWKAGSEFSYLHGGPVLRLARETSEGHEVVTDLTLKKISTYEIWPDATPIAGDDAVAFMQAVMDAAYDYGLRPSRGKDEADLRRHLEDMRDISRHLLKMDRPQK